MGLRIGLSAMVLAALLAASTNTFAQTLIERGSYLVNSVGACGNCHTPRAQGAPVMERQLSGGFQTFDEPWFAVKGSNLTPDRETGLGAWSDSDIKRAIKQGVRPNGVPLAPVMPFPFYGIINARDVDAIVAYVRSVAPIANPVQTPVYKTVMPVVPVPGTEKPMSEDEQLDPIKRGFYLASIAHCMACHARRSESEPADYSNNFGKGGRVFKGPWGESIVANISSHKEKGLGAWTDAEIRRSLVEGVSRDGRKLKPPMVDYSSYYRRLTEQDLTALVAWIRTIPAVE